jgi:Fe-Mn family superoxide dismutase
MKWPNVEAAQTSSAAWGLQHQAIGCNPAQVRGMSERLIVSHYENNYRGAVMRLNTIEEKLEAQWIMPSASNIGARKSKFATRSFRNRELFATRVTETCLPGTANRIGSKT